MKLLCKISLAALLALASCGTSDSVNELNSEVFNRNSYSVASKNPNIIPVREYYQSAYGKKGEALKKELNKIIKGHRIVSYDGAWSALKEVDADPSNKNNVVLFYSGASASKNLNGGGTNNWNREHVWAKSHGDFGTSRGPGTDIHHLRPTNTVINSVRGNKDFAEGGSSFKPNSNYSCNGCFTTKSTFEPPDRVKGDVARIMFYMAVRYEGGDGFPDLELREKEAGNTKAPIFGYLSTLIKWHLEDPVDRAEIERNQMVYENYQWNRNPFIDHPEWVTDIWGKINN